MRHTKLALAVLAAAILSACGSSDGDNNVQPAKPRFASQVSFGDSLSDVGTYNVGTVANLRGGRYTINGNNTAVNAALTGKNWTELLATQLSLPAPCAAVTGLDGDPSKGFAVPVTNNLNCTGYAQGGARVTNPVGPGNKLAGSALGQLTHPVAAQVANHLARNGGKFKGDEVVLVMAGGNDALSLLAELTAAATAAGNAAGKIEGDKVGAETFATGLATGLAAGATSPSTAAAAIGAAIATESKRPGSTSQSIVGVAVATAAAQPGNMAVGSPAVYGPIVAKAQADAATAGAAAGAKAGAAAGLAYATENGPKMVPRIGTAGHELADIIRNQIIAKGATHVVIVNLPDLGGTPFAKSQSASTQTLVNGMVNSYNIALRVALDGLDSKIAYVDVFAQFQDILANPSRYGVTNTAKPACGLNALDGNSLACNGTNLIAGDVSHYLFADGVHPTPFGYSLIAKAVSDAMIARGWL
ncbi:SGNH/GDSL hydrolase family protein [Massilia cavernae]|uniref:Esterase n=1 Tax=Massilia cavernae TaxID=2320864 RepID=A0A418XRZ7_9BURK|nr:SGNH/GDSL hydrolase family protein [Massilia cavernae]RJG15254.1 esterase [Massilia cavernae]